MAVTTFKTVQSYIQFLWNWNLSDGKLLDQNTANQRAAICVQCHNNKNSSEVRRGCSSCNKMGNAVSNALNAKIIKGNSTPYDNQLLTCGLCGCPNKISVWIPNQIQLKVEDANAFPTHCWKKKIQENLEV